MTCNQYKYERISCFTNINWNRRKPKISQYWSTDPLLNSPIFNVAMPRNLFQAIMDFLHFNGDSNNNISNAIRDRLNKVEPTIED